MKKAILALGCALFFASPAAAETLNNNSVIALVRAGLGNEAVIAKVKATEGKYDLSTDDLIALKTAGVPGDVIAAMLAASTKAQTPPLFCASAITCSVIVVLPDDSGP